MASFKEFFGYFLGHKALENITGFLTGAAGEKVVEMGGKALKTRFGGIDSVDELLTLSACKLAMTRFKVKKEDIVRVAKILKELSPQQRNKITNILGHDEQELKTETIAKDDKGKDVKTIKTEKINLRGAEIISMLAKMNDDEIRDALSGYGASDTIYERIKEIFFSLGEKAPEALALSKRVQASVPGANENWLGNLANKLEDAINEGEQS